MKSTGHIPLPILRTSSMVQSLVVDGYYRLGTSEVVLAEDVPSFVACRGGTQKPRQPIVPELSKEEDPVPLQERTCRA